MSKEFEQIVLQKLSKIDEIERKISDIDEIKQKVSKIDEIEKKVSDIDEIKQDVKNLKETLDVVKGSVIKLENKVDTEFKALYDVYDLNYDLQKENVQRVNSLEINSNDFSVRIEKLEEIA